MLAERRNSPSSGRPSTSRRTVWVRFPLATAAIARVTSVVGRRRSPTSELTETSISPQEPLDSWNRVRSDVRPSLPTACPTRVSSRAICWLAETISLKVSAIFPCKPVQYPGRRTEKSPSRMVCRPASITPRSADTDPLLPESCPFSFRSGLGSVPEVLAAASPSILFMRISRADNGSLDFQKGLQNTLWLSPNTCNQKASRNVRIRTAHIWIKIRGLGLTTSMLQAIYISSRAQLSSTVFHVETMGELP